MEPDPPTPCRVLSEITCASQPALRAAFSQYGVWGIRGNGRLSLITSPRAPAIRNRCSASPGVAAEVEVRGDLDAHEIFLRTGGLRFLTVDWLVRRWPVWPASVMPPFAANRGSRMDSKDVRCSARPVLSFRVDAVQEVEDRGGEGFRRLQRRVMTDAVELD